MTSKKRSKSQLEKSTNRDDDEDPSQKAPKIADDSVTKKKNCWKCSTCGRDNFVNSHAFGSHQNSCNKESAVVESELCMKPTSMLDKVGKLSNFNQIIITSIEFFEATQQDALSQARGGGKRTVQLRDIGLRCCHCARNGVLTSGSVYYPSHLKLIPFNVYVMVDRHLLVSCPNISPNLRSELRESKKNSTSESGKKGAIGLPSYLRLVTNHYGLTDNGKKDGIKRKREEATI